jgi:peptidoglycan/xylan/chitin deacetylase (PgdA/CDA1 family)
MSLPNTPAWTLAHIGLKFPGAAVLTGAAFFALADDPAPMVAITFDDGRKSVLEVALPILDQRDMVATAYLTTSLLNTSGHLQISDLQKFVSAEWELGSHGSYHVNMTELEETQLVANMIEPVQILAFYSGQEIFSFATPFGDYNEAVLDAAQKIYYNHANAWSESRGLNLPETFDPFNVHRLDVTEDISAEYLCHKLSNLPDDSLYSVIFHNITDEPGKYNTSIEKFETIVDCIAKSDANVVRMSDAVEAMLLK